MAPLNVGIQVNIERDPTRDGVMPEAVLALCHAIQGMDHLTLRGLMVLPRRRSDVEAQRKPFALLQALYQDLRQQGIVLDTLSMGMSDDFEAAILEGATMVRVGTALFGPRTTGQTL